MTTSLGSAAPLQILVPQLICFALNNSSIAVNGTKPDLDKIDRDMKKRNRMLGRKVEELQRKLEEATQQNLQLQSQVYSLHGNMTRVTQQLQESRLIQLQLAGNTSAVIVEAMATLYEERDMYKAKFDESEQQLKKIQSECSIIEQIVDVLVPDRALLLTEAVSLGNTSLVIPLIRLGTNVTAQDVYGFIPLDWAVVEGDADIARELLQAGSDVKTVQVLNDDTSLHTAARNGYIEIVQILLESGADPNAVNRYQNTPLHEAAFFGQVEVARLLLDAGALIDPRNNNNITPLLFAAEKGHLPVVKLLVQRGADRGVRNKAGRTAQEEAEQRGKQGVSWWLGQQT